MAFPEKTYILVLPNSIIDEKISTFQRIPDLAALLGRSIAVDAGLFAPCRGPMARRRYGGLLIQQAVHGHGLRLRHALRRARRLYGRYSRAIRLLRLAGRARRGGFRAERTQDAPYGYLSENVHRYAQQLPANPRDGQFFVRRTARARIPQCRRLHRRLAVEPPQRRSAALLRR